MLTEQNAVLKVLVLDEEIPYPPNSGKRIRTWNLLKRLAAKHSVHLLCYGRTDDASCAAVRDAGVVLHLVEPPPVANGLVLYAGLFANIFSPFPFSVTKHYSRKFQAALDELVKSEKWDVVQCEWTPYARFIRNVRVPTLITSHNVESQIWQRRANHSKGTIKRIFFRLQQWKMARFERRALRRAQAVTAVTECDAFTMKAWGVENVRVVPNGVDTEYYDSAPPPQNENEILSIASLDWFPNVDALEYFTDKILPLLRSQRPDAVLRVVGRRPPVSLKEKLSKLRNVEFVGEVDDVRPHLDRAAVIIVPLRIGGGSRLKILEALAAGKAVVSTSIGAEGLELQSEEHLRLADSPEEFAQKVTELLGSADQRRRLGENGKRIVAERFGWGSIATRLEQVWSRTASRDNREDLPTTRVLHLRASNFVGGPEKQILHHAIDIRKCGIDVWIGSFRDEKDQPEILEKAQQYGLPTFESQRSGALDPRAILDVAAFLRRARIQILCTHGFKANIIGALAKSLAGVPQIAFCRGWTGETRRVRFYEFLERRFLALADQIICVSEAQADYFSSKRWLQRRVSVVHNAMLDSVDTASSFDRDTAKTLLGFSPQTRLIGVVGRLSIEKGQRYLVEAAPQLAREFNDLKIVLLGEGRERASLESLRDRLGLHDVIFLPGFHKDVANWMRAFDVVANCSLTEGIPNAILEAFAVGTPVVATAVGGVPQLVKDRETGILVRPGDAQALGCGVAEVLRDSRLAFALGQSGREWARTRFSAAGQRDGLLAIYRKALGQIAPEAHPQEAAQRATPGNVQLEPATPKRPNSEPFITLVIPVKNEELHLEPVLRGLLDQEYPRDRYEILVVDGNSTDGTRAIVEKAATTSPTAIRFLPNPLGLSSAGRNVGVRHSAGELVFFVDGHCHIPARTLLRDAVRLFEQTGADCLCRPQPLRMENNSLLQKVIADARATALGHGLDSTIFDLKYEGPVDPSSAGALYRRSVFHRIGLYDESFDAAEDVEFNHRVRQAGLSSYISPRLAIEYQPRASLAALWRQMVRYGRGRFRLIRKHRDAFSFSQTLPALLVLGVLLGAPLSLVFQPFAVAYGASLALYALVVVLFSLGIAWRKGLASLLVAPGVFATIHFGLGVGFLSEALNWKREGRSLKSGRGLSQPGQEMPSQ